MGSSPMLQIARSIPPNSMVGRGVSSLKRNKELANRGSSEKF